MSEELCQSFALLPSRSEPRIWIAKPGQSRIKKFIRGRSLHAVALSVKGPTEHELCRTIVVSSHFSQPMVNQRRFTHTTPGNNRNDVDILVCPRTIQKGNILLSTK